MEFHYVTQTNLLMRRPTAQCNPPPPFISNSIETALFTFILLYYTRPVFPRSILIDQPHAFYICLQKIHEVTYGPDYIINQCSLIGGKKKG